MATLDGYRAVIGTAKLLAGYGAELTAAQAPAVQQWQDQGAPEYDQLQQGHLDPTCKVGYV